jgi:putative thiamine transport system permease protein
MAAWLNTVFPAVYRQIRLPVFAVLAFSLSVVDVSLVIGPSTPPPLAVRLLHWFNDPDLQQRFIASAGAILQLALVILSLLLWWGLEKLIAYLGLACLRRGWRWRRDAWLRAIALLPTVLCFASVFLGLIALLLWSLAQSWRFPAALPDSFTLNHWLRYGPNAWEPLWHTLSLGLGSALVALMLVIACLEQECHSGLRPSQRVLWLLYLPLLIPQVAFLFGLQVLLIRLRLDGHWFALLWSHLIFVLPYVFLSLADAYRAWDERYARSARCLGANALRVWFKIKLPMLLRPLLIATAVGFAVSVAQYLPTLFAGAGRYPTLTTEAVALSAGGNRYAMGVYGYLQLLLPWLIFALAQLIPAWLFRQRRGLQLAS